ncbi:MAG: hypothetical protein [Namikivirus ohi]|uniref:Phage conserved hypothetical protein C-terminal domain-containing protein n=1 Tax=Bacteriophage sp. TaxID=38018 RepID=A0ABY5T6Q1_9VIRU|nr:MAG: hypothetical protein [Bacteriophage sp.]
MKYTLEGFSQEAALSMQATITEGDRTKTIKLDLIDLSIIRWIVDFYPNMKKVLIEGTEYVWLDYSTFVEDMPLLALSNQSLYKRCMKMVRLGVLKHKTVRSKGTFSYYAFGPEYSRLVGGHNKGAQAPVTTQTPSQDVWGDTTNATQEQFQTPADEPQPLLNEPQAPTQPKGPDPTEEIVDHLNQRAGTHYKATTANTRKLIKARLKEGFTVNEFKLVIDKKCADWLNNRDMARYLRPETLFGPKFENYLNAQPLPQASINANSYANTAPQPIDAEGHMPQCTPENGWF